MMASRIRDVDSGQLRCRPSPSSKFRLGLPGYHPEAFSGQLDEGVKAPIHRVVSFEILLVSPLGRTRINTCRTSWIKREELIPLPGNNLGQAHKVGHSPYLHFAHHRAAVDLYRKFCQRQRTGNLFVHQAFCHA
jgi:hypothetical protein